MPRIYAVDSILYSDGTRFALPQILRSQNGWVYKPDMLRTEYEIKRGKNKVFSRSNGTQEASEFLYNTLEEHFKERKWERPTAIGNPSTSMPSRSGIHYLIAWQDPVFGWVACSIQVTPSAQRYSHGSAKITYSLDMHDLAEMLIFKSVSHQRSLSSTDSYSPETEKAEVPKAVQEWRADPWGVTLEKLDDKVRNGVQTYGPTAYSSQTQLDGIPTVKSRIADIIAEPLSIQRVSFDKDDEFSRYDAQQSGLGLDDNGFWAEADGNIQFFEKDVVKSIFKDSLKWEALFELIEALRFVGIEVSTMEEWTYNETGRREKAVTGIKFIIPKQGDTHRHEVLLAANNLNPRIEVDCGYHDDERLWVERKKRQAAEQMASLETELQTFEIDLGQ